MSVYDEMYGCIEGARSTDACEYSVYSEMFDLIAEAEVENAKLRELCGDLFDRLMDKDEHCGECRSQCEHDAWNFGDPKCVYAKRMCELGVPH